MEIDKGSRGLGVKRLGRRKAINIPLCIRMLFKITNVRRRSYIGLHPTEKSFRRDVMIWTVPKIKIILKFVILDFHVDGFPYWSWNRYRKRRRRLGWEIRLQSQKTFKPIKLTAYQNLLLTTRFWEDTATSIDRYLLLSKSWSASQILVSLALAGIIWASRVGKVICAVKICSNNCIKVIMNKG